MLPAEYRQRRRRKGRPGQKITIGVSTAILKEIARDTIRWETDPDWGYQVAAGIPGVELASYNPADYYTSGEYRELVEKLREERRQWLAKYPGLESDIIRAI